MTVESFDTSSTGEKSSLFPETVFGKMNLLTQLLQNPDLSQQELEQVHSLFLEVNSYIETVESRTISFFKDEVLDRLDALFPNDPIVESLRLSGQIVDDLTFHTGMDAFDRIIHHVETARTIHVKSFLWRDDEIGNRLGQALLDAAERGAKIVIEKDKIGGIFEYAERGRQSFFHKDSMTDRLLSSSDAVASFYPDENQAGSRDQKENTLADALMNHPNVTFKEDEFNDHSKYFVFDDEIVMTGGMNVGDEYATGVFHDYMVEFQSPILAQRLLDGEGLRAQDLEGLSSIDFVFNSLSGNEMEIKPVLLSLLSNAKHKVVFEMAYFGDREITKAIIDCAKRGVIVDIIMPEKANVGHDLNMSVIDEIIKETNGRNVNFYLYPDMLHAKVINIDEKITFMGSANLNKKGMEELGETNIIVNDDGPFTREMLEQLSLDKEKSRVLSFPPTVTFQRRRAWAEATFG
jgi:cardiolipin synthase A/B